MRTVGTFLLVSILTLIGMHSALSAAEAPKATQAPPEALAKWRGLRFGMFIHWGPVSLKGTEIGWSRGAPIPIEEYDNLYKKFNPVKFDADRWVKIAKDAGMKYMIFTTKHHDGFCMFDTKQTDYNIMHSPFGRDVTGELARACRKGGIRFGTYYSVCDWHNPDFTYGSPGGKTRKPHPNMDRYEQYLTAQVEELVHNYGPLLTVWFDVSAGVRAGFAERASWRNSALAQPDILINNRSGSAEASDYETPEQQIGKMQKKALGNLHDDRHAMVLETERQAEIAQGMSANAGQGGRRRRKSAAERRPRCPTDASSRVRSSGSTKSASG